MPPVKLSSTTATPSPTFERSSRRCFRAARPRAARVTKRGPWPVVRCRSCRSIRPGRPLRVPRLIRVRLVSPRQRTTDHGQRTTDKETKRASGFFGLLLRDQAAHALGQQGPIERLLERVVESQREGLVTGFIAGQGQQDRPLMVRALPQVLGDLTGFDPSQSHVDDDTVRVEAFGANARLESRGGRLDPEVVGLAQMLAQDRLERSIGADDQHLMINLGLEIAQGHSMLLEEAEEMLPRNATIL